MTKTIQLLRGTTAQNDAFTGAAGELTVDTTTNELRVHDGSTAGGHIIYTKSDVDTALSGKADTATTYTKTEVNNIASGKANVALDNLSSVGQNISNWSSNVSNCITEIPQDIKLELSSGTLTLKAGSKCYLKTDTTTPSINVTSDLTTTQSTNGTYFAIYNGSALTTVLTTTYDYSSLPNTYSLPLAVITVSGGAITSIDRVFNGFGYIGSTVFALPGVKGLIPNGRNADGTLNNTEFVFNSVITSTDVSNYSDVIYLLSDGTDINRRLYEGYSYDRYKNIVTYNGTQENKACIGLCYRQSGKISKLYSKPVFHSLDRSETDFIAHQAMPSGKYIDLPLLGSGGRYDAPADGWFVASSDGIITMSLKANRSGMTVNGAAGFAPWATIPASKGSYVLFSYSSNQNNKIRFYYAEGADY